MLCWLVRWAREIVLSISFDGWCSVWLVSGYTCSCKWEDEAYYYIICILKGALEEEKCKARNDDGGFMDECF